MTIADVIDYLSRSPSVLLELQGKEFKSIVAIDIAYKLGFFLMEEVNGTVHFVDRKWTDFGTFRLSTFTMTMKEALLYLRVTENVIVDVDLTQSRRL